MLENKLSYEDLIQLAKPMAYGFLCNNLQQDPDDFYIDGVQANLKENRYTFSDIKSVYITDAQPMGFIYRVSVAFYSERNRFGPIGFVFIGFSKPKERKNVKDAEAVEQ